MQVFVSGIHTDIGKTIVSSILVKSLNADYWKPVQAGGLSNTDADIVRKFNPNSKIFPSQYNLLNATSPHFAAIQENININIEDFVFPNSENLIIEGAGGLLSPLGNTFTNLDFIKFYKLPFVLVVKHYLGSITHTLSCLKIIENERLNFLGIIYVGNNENLTEEFIDNYAPSKVLGRINIFDTITDNFILQSSKYLKIF